MATDLMGRDFTIFRSLGRRPSIRTEQHDSRWLNGQCWGLGGCGGPLAPWHSSAAAAWRHQGSDSFRLRCTLSFTASRG